MAQRLQSEEHIDTARQAGLPVHPGGHLLSPPLLAEHLEAYLQVEDRRLRA